MLWLARLKERQLFPEHLCFVLRHSSNPVVCSVLDGGETCFSVLGCCPAPWPLPGAASHAVLVDTDCTLLGEGAKTGVFGLPALQI